MFSTGNIKNRIQFGTPFLLSVSGSIAVPDNAKIMLSYIVGGGGSGGASLGNVGGSMNSSGGGCGGGEFIQVDLEKWKWECSLNSASDTLILSATVGAGGAALSAVNNTVGIGGGTTTLALTGGLSVAVTGGGGGSTNGNAAAAGLLATANRFTLQNGGWGLIPSPVSLRPLTAQPNTYALIPTYNGDVLAAGGSANGTLSSEVGSAGGTITGVMLPWWMRQAGLAFGAGGNGAALVSTGKAAGGGAGGFGGNGGNAAVSNSAGATATAGSGYGSGGGGVAGVTGFTVNSGAGAPGCVVAVFGF